MSNPTMVEKIFNATEMLMAEYGLQGLSMQKIAKEAGISAGTIYLYFQNKEDLLKQLAQHIFDTFQVVLKRNYNPNLSLFEQYETMWNNLWNFLQDNPRIIVNHNQYQSLPHLPELCKMAEKSKQGVWAQFCKKGIESGEIVNLPTTVLWNLSIGSVIRQALDNLLSQFSFDEQLKKTVISCSYNAIANS